MMAALTLEPRCEGQIGDARCAYAAAHLLPDHQAPIHDGGCMVRDPLTQRPCVLPAGHASSLSWHAALVLLHGEHLVLRWNEVAS